MNLRLVPVLVVTLAASCAARRAPSPSPAPAVREATPAAAAPEVVADDGRRYTPEEILRIADALLSSDEAAPAADALPSRQVVIELLEKLLHDRPDGRWAEPAAMALGIFRAERGEEDQALRAFLAIGCASLVPGPLASPLPALALPDPFAACRPRGAGSRWLGEAWMRIGEIFFDRAEPGSLEVAIAAYRRALDATTAQDRINALARYKMAWSFYRLDRYPEAIDAFIALAEHPLAAELRREGIEYVAICVVEPDWDADGAPDPVTGLDRPEVRRLLARSAAWTREVLQTIGDTFTDLAEYAAAIRAYDELLARFPGDAAATAARARAVERSGSRP